MSFLIYIYIIATKKECNIQRVKDFSLILAVRVLKREFIGTCSAILFLERLRENQLRGSPVIEVESLRFFRRWVACSRSRLSLLRFMWRLRSSIVLTKAQTSLVLSYFWSVIIRVSFSTCRTALLLCWKSWVRKGRSQPLMLRQSYLRKARPSIPLRMPFHFSRSGPPLPLLVILRAFMFQHLLRTSPTSICSSPLAFERSSSTSPTYSGLCSSLSRSLRENTLCWASYLRRPTLFSNFSLSSIIEASCSENMRADSEKVLVFWAACFAWFLRWFLSFSALGHCAGFSSACRMLCFLWSLQIVLRSPSRVALSP